MPSIPYRVDLTERARRDLRHIYATIHAEDSQQARLWFNGLERTVLSLDQFPARGAAIPENCDFRHLIYGRRGHRYRIIYAIDEDRRVVTVLHIRHGARDAFAWADPDGET